MNIEQGTRNNEQGSKHPENAYYVAGPYIPLQNLAFLALFDTHLLFTTTFPFISIIFFSRFYTFNKD